MVAAKKGTLLDTNHEPNYHSLFQNDSIQQQNNESNESNESKEKLNATAPMEIGDFLWQCTLAYAQENEVSIMKRYNARKHS